MKNIFKYSVILIKKIIYKRFLLYIILWRLYSNYNWYKYLFYFYIIFNFYKLYRKVRFLRENEKLLYIYN